MYPYRLKPFEMSDFNQISIIQDALFGDLGLPANSYREYMHKALFLKTITGGKNSDIIGIIGVGPILPYFWKIPDCISSNSCREMNLCHLAVFFLDQKYTGKGIGSSVFASALKHIKNTRFDSIYVETIGESKAVGFYQKIGFKTLAKDTEYYHGEKCAEIMQLKIEKKIYIENCPICGDTCKIRIADHCNESDQECCLCHQIVCKKCMKTYSLYGDKAETPAQYRSKYVCLGCVPKCESCGGEIKGDIFECWECCKKICQSCLDSAAERYICLKCAR